MTPRASRWRCGSASRSRRVPTSPRCAPISSSTASRWRCTAKRPGGSASTRRRPARRGGRDAVRSSPGQPEHRHPLRQHACGEGPRRARSSHAPGAAGQGAPAAPDPRRRDRERLRPGVHGGLQPPLRASCWRRPSPRITACDRARSSRTSAFRLRCSSSKSSSASAPKPSSRNRPRPGEMPVCDEPERRGGPEWAASQRPQREAWTTENRTSLPWRKPGICTLGDTETPLLSPIRLPLGRARGLRRTPDHAREALDAGRGVARGAAHACAWDRSPPRGGGGFFRVLNEMSPALVDYTGPVRTADVWPDGFAEVSTTTTSARACWPGSSPGSSS